jgi:16S rRNA (guanine527-N7)-methyltransferase
MSPPGRPKGEYRRAEPEGTPVSPPGRRRPRSGRSASIGEYRKAQPEGNPVSALGGPEGEHRAPQADCIPDRALDHFLARMAMGLAKRGLA